MAASRRRISSARRCFSRTSEGGSRSDHGDQWPSCQLGFDVGMERALDCLWQPAQRPPYTPESGVNMNMLCVISQGVRAVNRETVDAGCEQGCGGGASASSGSRRIQCVGHWPADRFSRVRRARTFHGTDDLFVVKTPVTTTGIHSVLDTGLRMQSAARCARPVSVPAVHESGTQDRTVCPGHQDQHVQSYSVEIL